MQRFHLRRRRRRVSTQGDYVPPINEVNFFLTHEAAVQIHQALGEVDGRCLNNEATLPLDEVQTGLNEPIKQLDYLRDKVTKQIMVLHETTEAKLTARWHQ